MPSSIDDSGKSDASSGIRSWLSSVPNGSTVVFRAGGVYRLDRGLSLVNRKNLTIDGRGATLKANAGCNPGDSPFMIQGGSGITIRNFTLTGQAAGVGTSGALRNGCENQEAVGVYGASDILLSDLTMSRMAGDCVYLGPNGGTWASSVTLQDSSCALIGRSGLAITAARSVLVQRVTYNTLGLHVLDIEPDNSSGGGTSITFRNNTVGSFGLTSRFSGYFFAADGAAGSTINNVTVSGNKVSGTAHSGYDGSPRGLNTTVEVSRRKNIVVTNNKATVASTGTVMTFTHVDGLTVTGNVQPISSGRLIRVTDCTGVQAQ